jgi:host factor-I protein
LRAGIVFRRPERRGNHKEIGEMENKPAQNIQDSFLNTARKDKVPIALYLLSGVKLSGRIRSFDKYSVVLESNNQEQLIFKHAISTVVMGRGVHSEPRSVEPRGTETREARSAEPRAAEPQQARPAASSTPAPAPTGTEA